MASLTPGTLQKLLQNAGNRHFKVAGEHRSALLQVISIVPSLEDDPWKSRGFYLRVSDSVHSAYVSVSDQDTDLISSDKVQLGQFIHVAWLDSGSPVPVLRGIKPVPKRRACVGEPKDLISSDFLNAKKVETRVKKNPGNEQRRLSVGNGKVSNMESRRLSLDSNRRGWDSNSKLKDNSSAADSVVVKKGIIEKSPKNGSFSSPSSSSPLKNKNIVVAPKVLIKPLKSVKSLNEETFPVGFSKVAVNSKKLSELKVVWDALPSTISDLGKDVKSYREATFAIGVKALQEASISEDVIQCMSKFAQLCELSEKPNSGPLVEQFLNIYESILKASKATKTMITAGSSEDKSAFSWFQAAVQTDISKLSLYTKGGENSISNDEKHHYVVMENNQEKSSTLRSSKSAPRKKTQRTKGTMAWQPGLGLKDVSKLAEKLLLSSRAWFLDYLEGSLSEGFGLRRDETKILLGQLKRVNQWLDDAFESDERTEKLKKTLYRFLLDNVDSAVANRR